MPAIASWLAFGITPEIARQLCRISPVAIDRYLKKDKAALMLKGKSLTTTRFPQKPYPRPHLLHQLRAENSRVLQIDTVRHCLHTLTATDVSSGWIELFSLLNNAHKRTFEALSRLKHSALLPIREFHSGNGPEFINSAAELWCRTENLAFTRSRGRKRTTAVLSNRKTVP